MRWLSIILVPLMAVVCGCATGYTSKSIEQGHEQPKQTLVLVEGLVFQKQPGTNPPAMVRGESLAFGDAMASGICERLIKQGVDSKSIVMSGVQQREFPLWVAEGLNATNAEIATQPVEAPAKWKTDATKAAALSSLFTTLDAYDQSAMAFGAGRGVKMPKPVKPSKLAFSPEDFTVLFGRSITSVVVLAQGGALVRRDGTIMKDMGVAMGVALASAILSGGQGYVMTTPIYPWFVKAVAVDTATGEVLWADAILGQGMYQTSRKNNSQATTADVLSRKCPVFKAPK